MQSRFFTILLALSALAVVVTYETVPQGNAGPDPVDVLLVLGMPAKRDGAPSRAEVWRVTEAVHEFQRGQAKYILLSGGAAANRFVEADAMHQVAQRLGVPSEAIFEERSSLTTLENIRNSAKIMAAHHWNRVEVISSPDHLHRASVLLSRTNLQWRVHDAPTPGRGLLNRAMAYTKDPSQPRFFAGSETGQNQPFTLWRMEFGSCPERCTARISKPVRLVA